MSLAAGTRLGPYEIIAALGAGGMGEVYRARDTRLERTVAIKVLAPHLSATPESKQRFEREAKAISSLNHPYICQLYDVGLQDGTDYLVMEFLEGETLAERLRRGPLAVAELTKIGMQVAEALQVAHRAGIVHRDLKPGNIMLTKSSAKLMDFGLAKPAALGATASGTAPLLSAARTASGASPLSPLTTAGSIVGTIQYMSPEQIEGKEADARSDVFAMGAVLYEMATGKRAFEGKSQLTVASAILEKEPEPISAVQPVMPLALERLVKSCLEKAPEDRIQTAHDVKLQLKWIVEGGTEARPSKERKKASWMWLVPSLGGLVLAGALVYFERRPANTEMIEAYLPEPPNQSFVLLDDDGSGPAVISPDGTKVAFVATDVEGNRQIWLRALNEEEAKPIPGTERSTYPFWSPDGKWIGFFAEGKLKKVAANGGMTLALANAGRARGGSWGENGIILFAPTPTTGIFAVPAAGGTAKQITKPQEGVLTTHRWPYWLPGAKRFLYAAFHHSNPNSDKNGIYIATLDGHENRMIAAATSNAAADSSHLLYMQNGSLMEAPFDPARGEIKGEQSSVLQNVAWNASTWRAAFDVSRNGILIDQAGGSNATSQLAWYSPHAKEARILGEEGTYQQVRLSPDGKKLAVSIGQAPAILTLIDTATGVRTRLGFKGIYDYNMAWSPDGKKIAFTELTPTGYEIYIKDSAGSGEQQLAVGGSGFNIVEDWSPDSKYLVYDQLSPSSQTSSIMYMALGGDRKPQAYLTGSSPYGLCCARVSPDGRWVTYSQRDEGGDPHVYVSGFPTPNGKWQVSAGLGGSPHWRRDGKAIIYGGGNGSVMEVPVTLRETAVEVGAAHEYVKTGIPKAILWGETWDLAPDGRVIVNETRRQTEKSYITLRLNWTAELPK